MTGRNSGNWMWEHALELLEQANRLQRQFFEPRALDSGAPSWEPPVDAIEAEGEYWILVALPGVSPQRVRAVIDGAALIVQGERPMPARSYPGAIRRLEIPYGRFERRISIPAGRFELREQRFENGCLVIGLRRIV